MVVELCNRPLLSRQTEWRQEVEAVRKQVRHLGEADGRTWSIDERSDRCGRQRKFRLAFDQGDSPLAFISSSLRSMTARLGLRLCAAAKRMAELSDDVMDFARRRLGAGIGVNIAPVADVASALRNVIDELQLAHPERVIEERMGAIGMVHCDRARLKPLKQLMSNLLGNAITHGSTELPVRAEASADKNFFSLSVCNGGDVMGPDTLKKVFQPYWRPPTSAPGGGL